MPGDDVREVGALVLGGGISGIAATIRLRREAGIDDVVLIEQSHQLGGTWDHNTYPGCACDIPSSLYSFEFAPNPDWSRTFAHQPEILAYVKRVADEHGATERALLGTTATGASWDEGSQRWLIETSAGRFSTPVFVFAVGTLHEPVLPDVPGRESFEGTQFHSARWDHDRDLGGERVVVVGSGASAIQLVPHVQKRAAHLTYLQRTPGWVWPKPDWHTLRLERTLYRRFPILQRAMRRVQFGFSECLLWVYLRVNLARALSLVGRAHIRATVRDPELRRAVTPTHVTGCKRIMIANDYYPALVKDNVTVVPHGLREIRPHSVIAADGSEHEADTIIYATGFHAVDPPFIEHLVGRDGRTLAETWDGRPRAFMGASVTGFPNAFMLWGPNVGTGCNFVMVEAQVNYVIEAVRVMRAAGRPSFDIRQRVVDDWKDEMREKLSNSTWVRGGCQSWYQDEDEDVYAIYGGSMTELLGRSRDVEPAMYEAGEAVEAP